MIAPRKPVPTATRWRIVQRFNTLEKAEIFAEQLRTEGVEAVVTLIGGLSVIARHRQGAQDTIHCHPSANTATQRCLTSTIS